ncbi:hypothetical protein H9P43_008188 [Blastocladiella emersonii ATCC 22665]|nr:hypothetical protein H9P43_008188 [Blastocladiella emersonii ATCC 22665]
MNFSPTFSLRCLSRFTVLSELPSPPSSPFLFFNIEIPVRYSPGVPLINANASTDPLGLLQATAVAYRGSLLISNSYKADGFIKIDVCPSVTAPTFDAPKTLVFYPIASSLLGQLDPAIRYPDPAIISGLFTFGGGKTFAMCQPTLELAQPMTVMNGTSQFPNPTHRGQPAPRATTWSMSCVIPTNRVHGSKGLWVTGKTMLVSGPLFCGFEGAANDDHFTMSSSVAFFITEMRSVATATAPPPLQGPNGPPMFTAGPSSPAKMVPGAAAAPAALVPLMAACTTRSPTSTSASVNALSGGTTSGSTTSGSATTLSGPAASAVVQELDINLQEWDNVGSESDMTVVPASSSAATKNKNITKIVVDSEADEEVDANEEESECKSGPSLSSCRARKMATKAKGRDKNKTVKTPPASPTKRTRTSAVKGKSSAAIPAAQDDDEADDDDLATPPASPTKRARRGPAKGKGKDRSA